MCYASKPLGFADGQKSERIQKKTASLAKDPQNVSYRVISCPKQQQAARDRQRRQRAIMQYKHRRNNNSVLQVRDCTLLSSFPPWGFIRWKADKFEVAKGDGQYVSCYCMQCLYVESKTITCELRFFGDTSLNLTTM